MTSPIQDDKFETIKIGLALVVALLGLSGLVAYFFVHSASSKQAKAQTKSHVSLTAFFTDRFSASAPTNTPVHEPIDVAAALRNRFEIDGIPFSVGGIIRLKNKDMTQYPEAVRDIPIAKKARLIHFLHGTCYWSWDGVPVAKLVFHYADGTEHEENIYYGKQVRDWYQGKDDPAPAVGSSIAWSIHNPISDKEKDRLRIYRTTITNPHPDVAMVSMDYISTLTGCSPFMLAMTLEE